MPKGMPYHRYRKVDTNYYDLQPIYEWLKILNKPGNQVTDAERNSVRPMPEWKAPASRAYDYHFITSFYVTEILNEGIIVEPRGTSDAGGSHTTYGTRFFLVNYPYKDQLHDNQRIDFLALKTGLYRYEGQTLERYDYGIPFDPKTVAAEVAAERARTNPVASSKITKPSTSASAATIKFLQDKAAEGSPMAQYRLGEKYVKGDGVEANLELAKFWLQAACTNGSIEASNLLSKLQSGQITVRP